MYTVFFFFNDTATTEIYTLSLHDALPISDEFKDVELEHMLVDNCAMQLVRRLGQFDVILTENLFGEDRKSTRLNSSHLVISYAVFCLKKKKKWMRMNTAYKQPCFYQDCSK